MPLILVLALACRQVPPAASPVGPPTPDDGSTTTTSTEPTGTRTTDDTASTTTVTPTGQTSSTGDTHPTAADTSATATTGTTGATAGTSSTADTGFTSLTAHTGPATSHTGASAKTGTTGSTGSTGDTASVSTGDTALPCGWLPDSWPEEPEDPYLVDDTGVTCPPDDTSDTASTPLACPQIDWVLTATGAYQQSIVDVLTLSDGDIMVIGTDQAAITLAQGRPDEVTIPIDCSSGYSSWMARVSTDGTVQWAQRLSGSCGTSPALYAATTADGAFVTWGQYSLGAVTLGEATSNPLSLPDPVWGDQWFAVFEEDGTPRFARAISYPSHGGKIWRMTSDEAGAIYGIGDFDEPEITFNKGEPDELTLLRPEGAINPDISWIAAWEPNGDLRWAKLEGVVYGGAASLGGQAGGELTPYGGLFRVEDGELLLTSRHDGDVIYAACTEDETRGRARRVWTSRHSTLDGQLTAAPTSIDALQVTAATKGPHHNYYWGLASFWHDTMDGVRYESGEGGLWIGDDEGRPTAPPLRLRTDLTGLGVRNLVATENSLALLGTGLSDANAQYAFHCSDVIDGPDVQLNGNGGAAMWWLFTSELEQVCGGTLGPSTHITFADSGVTFDGDGGLVFGISIDDAFTFDEGGPNETHVDPDDVDAVIVRLAPP